MARGSALNALVEDMLAELESELERDHFVTQDAGATSCAGWEGDRESFSKRAAEFFCKDAFNVSVGLPSTIKCSGHKCVVRYLGPGGILPLFDITVNFALVPGVVTVSGEAAFLGLRPTTCSYRYACDAASINFTRIKCQIS